MLLTLFLLVVFAATAALVWFHGLWSNIVTLINILFAGFTATNFYEPLATMAVEQMPSYSYVVDFIILWALFALSFGLTRVITELISRQRLRFQPMVETIGRSVTAVIIAYVMVMFTTMTLHTAPIHASPFNGAWATTEDASFLGLRPDAQWLSFVRGQSQMGLSGSSVFDESGTFIPKYRDRRAALEGEESFLSN